MTETEWLASNDLDQMLTHLAGWTSQRKMRLFACACCRRVWPLMKPESTREAVEVSERYADGEARVKELRAAQYALPRNTLPHLAAYWTTAAAGTRSSGRCAGYAARLSGAGRTERAAQVELLRDVIGNPFHKVELNPAWLAWHGGTVRNIAAAIYVDRTFEQMPILADALEEAGCDDAEILRHCREPGVHVRGCWVLDLILSKG
jgi:hypothetical protein